MLTQLNDPRLSRVSRMLRQPSLCNGQATGMQCAHYWAIRRKMDVQNPEDLVDGQTDRFCTVLQFQTASDMHLGDGGLDMAVSCNRYVASERPYDVSFEEQKFLSVEERMLLREELEALAASENNPNTEDNNG